MTSWKMVSTETVTFVRFTLYFRNTHADGFESVAGVLMWSFVTYKVNIDFAIGLNTYQTYQTLTPSQCFPERFIKFYTEKNICSESVYNSFGNLH